MSKTKKSVKHVDLFWVQEDPADVRQLVVSNKYHGDSAVKASPESITPDAVADMLDLDAEGDNQHGLVGAHLKLVEILRASTTEESTLEVMRSIADHGGLHNLAN